MARTLAKARVDAKPRETEILAQAIAGAVQLHRKGNVDEAAALYQRVLEVKPDHFDALHLLGVLRQQQGDSAEALRLIDLALRIIPGSADALSNRGVVLKALDRLGESLASYDRAIAINPRQTDALVNRPRVLLGLGRFEEALEASDKVLALDANTRSAVAAKAHALFQLKRSEDALACFERLLLLAPGDVEALYGLAVVLFSLGRYDDSLQHYDTLLARQPDRADARIGRGHVLLKLDRPERALADFDRALALRPNDADRLKDRGIALGVLNRCEEAVCSFEQALAINPDDAELYYNRSLARLTAGDLRAGWSDHEWRWKTSRWSSRRRDFAQPQWRGDQSVAGKTILLHSEQGFGDTLQFVRYAPLLARRGAKVVLDIQPELKTLLAQLPSVEALTRGDRPPPFDLHCSLTSLPFAFGTELVTIPAEIPYLRAPDDRLPRWCERLGERRAPRVGVVWAGSAAHENDRNRSIALDRFSLVLSTPGIEFVSLQRDVSPENAAVLRQFGMLDLGEELTDFSDTAAVISLFDLVVAVDTAVVHLAGAMGKPVWILLPFAPDFRWLLDRSDSPWYPTARLYRQSAIGDWEYPLDAVRRDLMSLACGG